jgi:transcription-repair coupling factor (superfamily II helicase)
MTGTGEPPRPVRNLLGSPGFRAHARAAGLREVTLQGRYVRFGPLSLHDWQRVRLAIGVLRGEGSWSRVMRQ